MTAEGYMETEHTPSEIVHDCPRDGEAVTLCCGRSPFELPRGDRMTLDSLLVSCEGAR